MNTKIFILVASSILFIACGQGMRSINDSQGQQDKNSNELGQNFQWGDGSVNSGQGLNTQTGDSSLQKVVVDLSLSAAAENDCSSNEAGFTISMRNTDVDLLVCNEHYYNVPDSSPYFEQSSFCDTDSKFTNLASLQSWTYSPATRSYLFDATQSRDFIRSSIKPGFYRTVAKDSQGNTSYSSWVEFKRQGKDHCNPQEPSSQSSTTNSQASTNTNSSGSGFSPAGIAFGGGSGTPAPVSTAPVSTVSAIGGVKGHIDNVIKSGDRHYVRGWVCEVGEVRSLTVHIYVDGQAGIGKLVASRVANKAHEAAVDSQCGTRYAKHRFEILVNLQSGQNVWVHGISKNGNANALLAGSGRYGY